MAETRLVAREKLRDHIKQELAVEDVISSLASPLVKSGREWRGHCPFHEDKDPSLYVSTEKQVWVCHSCKRGGDIFTFIQELEGIKYVEALYRLAELAGIDTSPYERPLTEAERDALQLRKDLDVYIRHSMDNLLAKAPGYRGLDEGTIRLYGVGLTDGPPKTNVWFEDLNRKEIWDGSVVYPIRDYTGDLVSLMFRTKSGKPKYVRTHKDFPLTPRNEVMLYGIDRARPHALHGQLVLVEGQHDVLALANSGIRNVAGLNGTVFGKEQMELLAGMRIEEIVLLLDNDDAGRRRTLEIAKEFAGQEPRLLVANTLNWEDGVDPADAIDAGLLEHVEAAILGAKDAIDFVIMSIWRAGDRTSITSRLGFINELKTFLQSCPLSQAALAMVAKWVSDLAGVPFLEISDLLQGKNGPGALHSIESERIVLGAMLRDLSKVITLDVPERAFYHTRHRAIYQLLLASYHAGIRTLDMVAFKAEAAILNLDQALEDTSYVEHLLTMDSSNLEFHLDQVNSLYFRRAVIDRFREADVAVRDIKVDPLETVAEVVSDIVGLTSNRGSEKEFSTMADATDSSMELIYERMASGTPIIGLDMGESYPLINKTLQGLVGGRVHLILSSQGRGKTALICNWAHQVSILNHNPSLFIELEMTREELTFRFLALMTGVEHMRIAAGAISNEEARKIERAAIVLRQSPLHIYAPSMLNRMTLEMVVRRYKLQHDIKACWLDYIQLVSPAPGEERMNRYGQLGELSRSMKMRIARELDVALVAAAQLNREASKIAESTSENVGDSYRLAQDADIVLIIREVKGGDIELWIDKNRSAKKQVLVPVKFDRESQWIVETMHGPQTPSWRG